MPLGVIISLIVLAIACLCALIPVVPLLIFWGIYYILWYAYGNRKVKRYKIDMWGEATSDFEYYDNYPQHPVLVAISFVLALALSIIYFFSMFNH